MKEAEQIYKKTFFLIKIKSLLLFYTFSGIQQPQTQHKPSQPQTPETNNTKVPLIIHKKTQITSEGKRKDKFEFLKL